MQKKWRDNLTLRVGFMGGDPVVKDKIKALAPTWSQFCNIKFQFMDHLDAEIRISFHEAAPPGPTMGTDALTIPGTRRR